MRLELLWVLLALLALGGLIVYRRFRDDIAFYARLFNAKRLADQFYATYPHLSKDVAYGPGAAHRLDVYRPAAGGPHPVLVYVHGGSWNSGNKELYAPAAQRFVREGLVVVVPGYTLYPKGTYRQQVEDVTAALAWTLENVERFGGDPRRVVVGGQSAGAHLAALAVLDERWLGARDHSGAEICGWYGVSGVYDIHTQMDFERANGRKGELLLAVMEGQPNFAAASPITYTRPGLPPILLVHGDADRTVPVSMAQSFHARLQSVGARSELKVYPRAGHSGLLFDALANDPARLIADLAEFALNCPPVASLISNIQVKPDREC